MGDEAEQVFETVATRHNWGYHRSGLNRPPFDMSRLPVNVRYTPDYLTETSYVEVQGFGKDRLVKIKQDKLDALAWWDANCFCTEIFLWDSVLRRWTIIEIGWFKHEPPSMHGVYPEGKTWLGWTLDQLPALWTDLG